MLCALCNKNEATIHIQEIASGSKKTLHICNECAAKKAMDNPALEMSGFKLAEMLYNLTEKLKKSGAQLATNKDGESDKSSLTCPACGWDTQGLRNTGRLGCAHCYETFSEIIDNALGNMHQGKVHLGKKPGEVIDSASSQLLLQVMSLQKDLEVHVSREDYESAAAVRDQINKLKRKIQRANAKSKKNNEPEN